MQHVQQAGNTPTTSAAKLSIGTLTSGVPFVIPDTRFTLRVYTNHLNVSFSATDVYGGVITDCPTSGYIPALPYWNGSAEESAASAMIPFFIDFDGRTFSTVTWSSGTPFYALLMTPNWEAPP